MSKMNCKQLAFTGLPAALLCIIAIGVLDRPVAEFVHQQGKGAAIFSQGTAWIETAFGWGISKLALGYSLLATGAILRRRATRFLPAMRRIFGACIFRWPSSFRATAFR